MKKYLMMGAAVLAMSSAFVSCSSDKDLYDPNGKVNLVIDNYNKLFVETFGQPAANQNWGFGATPNSARATRSAVIEGDPFNYETTDSYYISSESEIPGTAKTYAEAVSAVTTVYSWGSNFNENAFQNATDVILPDGEYSIHWWTGTHTLYVTGNATMNVLENASSINQAKIYVLTGATLTLNMTNVAYINNLEIYVAAGGTLNYGYDKLYKQTGGGKIYNRGTVNFTKDEFQANQNAIVYNEGDMVINNLTSGPGSGSPSCFYNFANLEVKGYVQLNSCANFLNEGTTTVVGKTDVTQQGIYWINKGHYTTASMEFSAWNSTFYNFCQLYVSGEAHMYDGAFNLMDNSYTEVGSAKMNNFVVNMGSNTGMNIKGDLSVYGQGDNHYQGFTTDGTNDYLRVGGTITVGAHKLTLELTGDITYAYNNLVDLGASDTGVQPTYRFNAGTKKAELSKLTVTPNEEDCGATWGNGGGGGGNIPNIVGLHVMAEDLTAEDPGDLDFNDVVIDVIRQSGTQVKIRLQAAGGTLPLRINEDDNWEVHLLFGVDTKCMVNTGTRYHRARSPYSQTEYLDPVELTLDIANVNWGDMESGVNKSAWSEDQDTFAEQVRGIKLEVSYDEGNHWTELLAKRGHAASKVATQLNPYVAGWYEHQECNYNYQWPWEKQNIGDGFAQWVINPSAGWYSVSD